MTKKPRCDIKETDDRAWRRCTKAPGHDGKCRFGSWSLSAQDSEVACARCGHQADAGELGPCAGCERECCMVCLEDGTCRACLAEERAEGFASFAGLPSGNVTAERISEPALEAMQKILTLCQEAEDGWRYSDNEGSEGRAQGLLDKLEKIAEVARGYVSG